MQSVVQGRRENPFCLIPQHRADDFRAALCVGYMYLSEAAASPPNVDSLIRGPAGKMMLFFYLEGVLAKELGHDRAFADLVCVQPDASMSSQQIEELARRFSGEAYAHYLTLLYLDVCSVLNQAQLFHVLPHHEGDQWHIDGSVIDYELMHVPVVEVW